MKKYSEHDIEKMLSKTEKTDASFDKKVDFPANTLIYKRRRFTSLLVAACLVVFIVSGSAIIALVQNGGSQINYSNDEFMSDDKVNDSDDFIFNTNSPSDSKGPESYPYGDSDSESTSDYSEGDETRNPYGDSLGPNDESEGSGEISNVEPVLPQIVYPDDNEFFLDKGIGSMTPEEYFSSNPNSALKGRSKLHVYSRTLLDLSERRSQIDLFAKTFGIDLTFDEELYKITGDCRGIDKDRRFSVNVSEYGDWYLLSKDGIPMRIDTSDSEADVKIRSMVDGFVNNHREIFGQGVFKYSYKYLDKSLEVYICTSSDDKIISNTPQFILTFKIIHEGYYRLTSIKRNIANMQTCGEYPVRSYSEALNDFFKQPIFDESDLVLSEDEKVKCVYVGYDIRYLYSSRYECMYPFYAFVLRYEPNDEAPKYEAFYVPAIESEYVQTSE